MGHVVGFLGDGINDSPALHVADVGIFVDSAVDIAKAAAAVILLEKDLTVLNAGVIEGRKIFVNILKYVRMGASSNFGNMFSVLGASAFLPFVPMAPIHVLTNNLLYDFSQVPIPTDTVGPEQTAKPRPWNMGDIQRFVLFIGPVSSIFDFLTFFVMLQVLHASHAEFRSGWFVESLATQTLVVYVIRTRRVPFFHSRPSLPMLITPLACALIGAALPFTPLAGVLGFATLPISFFLILLGMIATYLLLVEIAKRRFYAVQTHPRRPRPTRQQRHQRRIQRRAAHLIHHPTPQPRRARPVCVGKYRVAEYTALWLIANPNPS